jgi:predicted dehydrogenase
MKQVFQYVRSGQTIVADVPAPQMESDHVLVRVGASLVSAGTERMVVDFAQSNLLQKARSRPDLVQQTLEKAKRDGLVPTVEAVRSRLDRPLPLGYSSAGTVIDVGAGISDLRIGDRVACGGAGAAHAEIASVPRHLVALLPESVDLESAAFTTLGAIALHGVRLAEATLGGVVAVIGLGLVGQLAVQLLRAAGCTVVAMDIQPERADLGLQLGARATTTDPEALVSLCGYYSSHHGADAVVITADTKSNDPVDVAGKVARDRAVVVAVGAVGTHIPRKVYYEKELDFRISRSYGPGRYDPLYEERGQDYPIGYVRWTENRNMEAFVQLLEEEKVRIQPLITHRFPIEEGDKAYDLITGKHDEPFLAVLLTYGEQAMPHRRIELARRPDGLSQAFQPESQSSVRVGLLGAGNFATTTLLPAMQGIPGMEFIGVSTGTGLSARHAADKWGFRFCATDEQQIMDDPDINTIVIATRHNLHARQAIASMTAGKGVFVEKPLALNCDELVEVIRTQQQTGRRLMVGFNRRFAPMVLEMRRFLQDRARPVIVSYRINAGHVPSDHWTQDPEVGGGRIIGEVCHFIDLLQYVVGAPPVTVSANAVAVAGHRANDEVVITLSFVDGSIGTIIYSAGGDRSYGKERVEVFGDGRVAVLDDYRYLELVQGGRHHRTREHLRANKGHRAEWEALTAAVRSGKPDPIPIGELVVTHLATFAAVESLRADAPIPVDKDTFGDRIPIDVDADRRDKSQYDKRETQER